MKHSLSQNFATKAAFHLKEMAGARTVEDAIETIVSKLRQDAIDAGYYSGMKKAPFDPRMLAFFLGAQIATTKGVDSSILHNTGYHAGNKIVIDISSSGDFARRQRFSLAHEVAHLVLLKSGAVSSSRSFGKTAANSEIEKLCNLIAAEILAPGKQVREIANRFWKESGSTYSSLVIKITDAFDISLYAAIMRLVELMHIQIGAMLFNPTKETVEWCYLIAKRIEPMLQEALSQEILNNRISGVASLSDFVGAEMKSRIFDWHSTRSGSVLTVLRA